MAMKFKTFRGIVITGLILVVCGIGFALNKGQGPAHDPHAGHSHGPEGHSHSTQATSADALAEALEAQARDMEGRANAALGDLQANRDPHADPMLAAILERIEEPLAGAKVKDALKGETYKVNLYGSGGKVERVKVDIDRDDRWDEKWTLETPGVPEGLKRQISGADDDATYDRELFYRGGIFRPAEGSGPPPASADPSGPASTTAPSQPEVSTSGPLEPHQRQLLERVQAGIGGPGSKLKDPFKSGPKVNLYHDAGQPIPNRAKLDLDRDGKWDEKWDFEQGPEGLKVKRRVSTGDDDSFYDKDYRLRAGKWVLK